MSKTFKSLFAFILLACILCMSVFAATPRWKNVASISPSISAGDGAYTSYIIGLNGTTKIECTLTLYEKGLFGNYKQVAQTSSTFYGQQHEFIGYYAIKAGTIYKLTTTATVTCNGVVETVSTDFEKRC